MEFKDVVSVTGVGGLKRVLKQRPDGLIVCNLDGTEKKFMSNRIHMFTPLENISMYTNQDSVPLNEVFWNMKQIFAEYPPVSPKSSVEDLRAYMERALPDHDRDQVFVSDIKKLIKWYNILDPIGLVKDPEAKEEDDEGEESTSTDNSEDDSQDESNDESVDEIKDSPDAVTTQEAGDTTGDNEDEPDI